VPNKSTQALRVTVDKILANHINTVSDLIADIEDPVDRMNIIIKLLEFSLPKLKRIDMIGEVEAKIQNVSFEVHHVESVDFDETKD